MRIARALSVLGYASRREAERLIAEGRVRCNGTVVSSPATIVELGVDQLQVEDQPLASVPTHRYFALYKPRGVVSSVWDPHADRTVVDLIPSDVRLYPVGRLDKDSEGLILLTNDGAFANRVAHPRYETEKEYRALVDEPPSLETIRRLRSGVMLDGQRTAPARVRIEEETREGTWVQLVLHEGRNREVRKMLFSFGHEVRRLVRTRIGPISLGRLQPSQYRQLRPDEVRQLTASDEPKSRRERPAAASGPVKSSRGPRSVRK
jgi:23S rRNA pseudouridine2605 synthase